MKSYLSVLVDHCCFQACSQSTTGTRRAPSSCKHPLHLANVTISYRSTTFYGFVSVWDGFPFLHTFVMKPSMTCSDTGYGFSRDALAE
jgi:hypothetical protein